MYEMTFSSFQSNNTGFTSSMNSFLDQILVPYNVKTSNQNLAYNLILVTNSVISLVTGVTVQEITFAGNPSYVFNRQNLYTGIGKKNSFCYAPSLTTFDVPTATLLTTYDYDGYVSNGCDKTVAAFNLGYQNKPLSGPDIRIPLDMRSLMTAMAVNLKVLTLGNLEQVALSNIIAENQYNFEYKGVQYSFSQYFDVRYPGMTPIGCLLRSATESLYFCFLKVQNILAFPLLNHAGNNQTYPQYCNW